MLTSPRPPNSGFACYEHALTRANQVDAGLTRMTPPRAGQ
jgi:hypothetical protein